MLAHRARTGLSIAVAAVATGALALLTPPAPQAEVALVIPDVPAVTVRTPPAPALASPCPRGVRELAHVDAAATLTCVPGNFGAPGWYVRAVYKTSELWERTGVVSDDLSRILVDFTDEPSHVARSATVGLVDLDGDGIDEVRTIYELLGHDRWETGIETRKLGPDGFVISYVVHYDREY